MSTDAILDLSAAAVVFGTLLVVAYWDSIRIKARNLRLRGKKSAARSPTAPQWRSL